MQRRLSIIIRIVTIVLQFDTLVFVNSDVFLCRMNPSFDDVEKLISKEFVTEMSVYVTLSAHTL